MSRSRVGFASLVLGIAAVPLSASAADPINYLNRHGELGLGAEHMSYHEPNPNGGDYDSDSGDPFSGRISLAYQGTLLNIENLRAEFGFRWALGSAEYNGYAVAPRTGALVPVVASVNETVTDYQLRLGKGFKLTGYDLLTPYLMYGLGDWNRDLGSDSEDFSHYYWAGGLQYQYLVTPKLVLSADVGVGETQNPEVHISSNATTYSLGVEPYLDYRIGVRYSPTRYSYVGLDGYWTTYRYGQSSATNGDEYPASKTTHSGAQAVLGFTY